MSKQKVIVVGSGIAGLTCALDLAEYGHEVIIITKSKASDSATFYAQGGIASQWFNDLDDSSELHVQDTMTTGAGLADRSTVTTLVQRSKAAIEKLLSRGAQFDLLSDGTFARTIEGGHSRSRIIHSGGDKTGQEIERALVSYVENLELDISIYDYHFVNDLIIENNSCVGVTAIDIDNQTIEMRADHVVLATGGAGQVFAVTTNPLLATGDGIALALKSGVVCADLEFMQFHPTALHVDDMPRPLISEALRGAGAVLVDQNGVEFLKGVHPLGSLAPRDVVSRAIYHYMAETGNDCVYLDARSISGIENKFPTIYSSCKKVGIDPTMQLIPVSPASHYYCGGIAVDINGATSLANLWAVGEVACNSVHGANRLASNSLLDGLVFGSIAAESIDKGIKSAGRTAMFKNFDKPTKTFQLSPIEQLSYNHIRNNGARSELQKIMNSDVGVIRELQKIEQAENEIKRIIDLAQEPNSKITVFEQLEMQNLIVVAQAMIASARVRKESRGCHSLMDITESLGEYKGHFLLLPQDHSIAFVDA